MSDKLAAFFAHNLPSVPHAAEFALGMMHYYTSYKEHREASMNYERDPDYLSERVCIMPIQEDQYWHHSTQFKKTIAQAIQDLFKTKIVGVSLNFVRMDPLMYFVDEESNRWGMEVENSKLYAYFPRFKTRVNHSIVYNKILSSPDFEEPSIAVQPVADWCI